MMPFSPTTRFFLQIDHRFEMLYCQYCQYNFDHSYFELHDVKCKDENNKKKHQLQQSCGATLALKAHGVTAEKVQLKLQDLLVCENALKRTSIEA